MGMTTKSGRYFANPSIGRAHERAEGSALERESKTREAERDDEGRDAAGHARGGARSVHVFRGADGTHHVVAHHEDGPEFTEHGSADEAMDHAKQAMSPGSDENGEDDEGAGQGPSGFGASALESTL